VATVKLNPLLAQWVQTNGPYDGNVGTFAVTGANLIAGTYEGGIYRFADKGLSRAAANAGLTDADVRALVVSEMVH
jgi:hypothetical protein